MSKSLVQNEARQPFRLNRAIAQTGLCSRRKADELIAAGRVKVNGHIVESLAVVIDPRKDVLSVDGQILSKPRYEYILLHKPKGIITSCKDEKGRRSVVDLLPTALKHLKPLGRLDRDSSGLLLLTNDGSLIQSITHPTKAIPKTYRVTVAGELTSKALDTLKSGVNLDDGRTLPAQVRLITRSDDQCCFEMVIFEGRNRQIRRMCGSLGLPVLSLIRVAVGELQLKGLEPGSWRRLSIQERSQLKLD